MSYAIRVGCILKLELPIFELKQGRSAKWKKTNKTSAYNLLGNQVLKIEVLRESYGEKTGQHTFSCKVIRRYKKGTTYEKRKTGDIFLIKGRNLYPNVVEHFQGNESKEVSK